MRLFVALNLPASVREEIREAVDPLRDSGYPVRWTEPANYHLTLKFLGNVAGDRVPLVQKVLARVAAETGPFPLVLEGIGAFPTIRRPQVLWLGADPSPALRCLKQDLEWGFADHGFERETRAFHPHLTLGRADREVGAGVFRGLDERAADLDFRANVKIEHVDLVRSHLSREGARYTVIGEAPLHVPQPRT